jgi:hypothetical protein
MTFNLLQIREITIRETGVEALVGEDFHHLHHCHLSYQLLLCNPTRLRKGSQNPLPLIQVE